MIEIERKFLIKGNFYPYIVRSEQIVQGYLMVSPEKVVRIRIRGGVIGSITIKKNVNKIGGIARMEYEYSIPVQEAEELLLLCLPSKIEKERNTVPFGRHVFEVDVFHGKNEGLVIAELELKSENEPVEYPEWLGKEVTGEKSYYNANLANRR